MLSIRQIYKTGMGPSSSHTMGPRKAAGIFAEKNKDAASFKVYLYSALALTGKGHLTDKAVTDGLAPKPVEIVWEYDKSLPLHPNGMIFEALNSDKQITDSWVVYSIGGGDIRSAEDFKKESCLWNIYPHKYMTEILKYTAEKNMTLWQYVEEVEGEGIWPFLSDVWKVMNGAIERGMTAPGILPGGLGLERKAYKFKARSDAAPRDAKRIYKLYAYALACSEENAAGGLVVTAPTCGSCGILPALLRVCKEAYEVEEGVIVRALATAALVGNLAKANASVSGAEVGCQGEVGVACAMAAAAACQIIGGSNKQIEYAAEMGLEHHLGLTCDPVEGLVQIPCIERNAIAAARAEDCAAYAMVAGGGESKISYDEVLETMMQTGKDMKAAYRETSRGGLAEVFRKRMEENLKS